MLYLVPVLHGLQPTKQRQHDDPEYADCGAQRSNRGRSDSAGLRSNRAFGAGRTALARSTRKMCAESPLLVPNHHHLKWNMKGTAQGLVCGDVAAQTVSVQDGGVQRLNLKASACFRSSAC